MRKLYIYIVHVVLVSLFILLMSEPASGQKKNATRITVSLEVVDSSGKPIETACVASSRNRYTYELDIDGKISISVLPADVLKIMSDGYETQVVNASDFKDGFLKVSLEKLPEHGSESDRLYTLPGDYVDAYRTVGSYSKVEGEELETNPTTFLWDALGGRLNGLFAMDQSVVPGFSNWTGFVRSPNGGTPVIMIDGVERSLDYIEPETIESVQLLKDASLKSLFGGVQSNGIILIKTKRGNPYENGVRVNVQSGVAIPTRLPGYLNSREYTAMYNQALANIGKSPVYDPAKYDGSNPLLYPDVDYYDDTDLSESMQDVYAQTRCPFIIIIDEWDCIFREYKQDREAQETYLDFLRDLLKDKSYIHLAYMTGILPIKKYGTHSALNMFDEFSMIDPGPLASYVGFTDDEVREVFLYRTARCGQNM